MKDLKLIRKGNGKPSDAQTQRMEKISRLKREKEAEKMLKVRNEEGIMLN